MFTGIIEEVGEVVEARVGLLRIRASRIQDGTKLGDSIAIDGVDLTVAEMKGTELSFNVMAETYRVTTLGRLGTRSRVNLERAMRAEDRLSGHVVRGVVEGTGRIRISVSRRRRTSEGLPPESGANSDEASCELNEALQHGNHLVEGSGRWPSESIRVTGSGCGRRESRITAGAGASTARRRTRRRTMRVSSCRTSRGSARRPFRSNKRRRRCGCSLSTTSRTLSNEARAPTL